jgi:hypothetical protein
MKSQIPVFYLAARSYTSTSAGIRAMHLLCHRLNILNFEAYLVPVDKKFQCNLELETPIVSKKIRNHHLETNRKIVTVYDESIVGNPLKGDFTINWNLNFPGYIAGNNKLIQKSNSMRFVYAQEIDPGGPRLFINTVDHHFFGNFKVFEKRDLILFYAGKLRSLGLKVTKPENAIEIHRSGPSRQSREELRDLFSRAKLLYLAEDSAMVLEAALCGCPSVLLKNYFRKPILSLGDGGIGLSVDDSPKAIGDVNLATEFLENYIALLEIRSNEDTLGMILKATAQLDYSTKKSKTRIRLPIIAKFRMRLNKLIAAFRSSGFRGVKAIFMSHLQER